LAGDRKDRAVTPMSVRDAVAPLPPDAALADRDRLLDDRTAAAVLGGVLPASGTLRFDRVERVRAKYRAGESLRTLHRVWCGKRSWLVSARMKAGALSGPAATTIGRAQPCFPLRGVAQCESLGATFWTFPNDRIIRNAGALKADLPVLARLFPGRALAIDIVSYNPEQAVIAAVSDGDGRPAAFAKLFARGGSKTPARILGWLGSAIDREGSCLEVPRLLAIEPRLDVLVLESAGSDHMTELQDDRVDPFFSGLGAALGRLHLLPAPPFDRFARFDSSQFGRVSELVAWVRPDLGALARQVACRLDRARPESGDPVCVHGDMNRRNWIARNGSVALIDFDDAATGPAAADVGAVMAWLRTRTLTGDWTPDREHELTESFLAGYSAVRPLPSFRDLLWFRAAALLADRAGRAITRIRTEHLTCLGELIRAAHADALECTRA